MIPPAVTLLERAVLSERLNSSAAHRTPEFALQVWENNIKMSSTPGPQQFFIGTIVCQTVTGHIGSAPVARLLESTQKLINDGAINKTTPTVLLKDPSFTGLVIPNLFYRQLVIPHNAIVNPSSLLGGAHNWTIHRHRTRRCSRIRHQNETMSIIIGIFPGGYHPLAGSK